MQLSIKKFFQRATNIVFPAKCVICNVMTSEGLALCSECWKKIDFITDPNCELCGFPFDFDAGEGVFCAECNQAPPYFDKALSLFKYSKHSKALIFKLKYHDQLHVAQFLARLIADKLQKLYEYRVVMSVPLHGKRIRKRLYNQSAVIGSHVAKLTRLEFFPNALIKKRHDTPQNQLSRRQRKKNVLNSFDIADEDKKFIEGRNIILIDDVYTTGSTANECSKTLKKAGCGKILVVTAARVTL
jgi:ComF family protein